MKRIILFFTLLFGILIIGPSIWADNTDSFTISGEIKFTETGKIYISLVTEDEFDNRGKSQPVNRLILTPSQQNEADGFILFEFTNISQESYVIRFFQDVNNNGELDKGLFGIPKEPWGIYKPNTSFGKPDFDDCCFEIDSNVNGLILEMED